MNEPIPSNVAPLPTWRNNVDAFYGAVNAHLLTVAHGWCEPGTKHCLILHNPDVADMDLVFCDDVPAAARQLLTRLTDEQLQDILAERWGGPVQLPEPTE